VSGSPSSILGTLQSNGRVFLVNPNGIVFGPGSFVDVAGLVASSLNLSTDDFLSGRLRFTETPGAGRVENNGGFLSTMSQPGGHIYLVGPAVTNGGFIASPQGEVVLAAGQSVELVDAGTPNLRVEIVAPANEALNLGTVFADSGRIGIYAGLINHSGFLGANSAVALPDGRIVLQSTGRTTLSPGSAIVAIGNGAGAVNIQAGELTVSGDVISDTQSVSVAGDMTVRSQAGPVQVFTNGQQTLSVGGALTVDAATSNAQVVANGHQSVDVGGTVTIQGGSSGSNRRARINSNSSQEVSAANIAINGGTGNNNFAEMSQFGTDGEQSITVTGGGTLALQGGSGGSTNSARIRNFGTAQTIDFSSGGALALTGGDGVSNDFAQILADAGSQTISGLPSITMTSGTGGLADAGNRTQIRATEGPQRIDAGSLTMTGGPSGTSNNTLIQAPTQVIHVEGDLTMTAGNAAAGVSNAGGARIGSVGGSDPQATNLTLTVNGNVTMTGSATSSATLGSSSRGVADPAASNVTLAATGDVTLNPGTVGTARIGPDESAGGNISVAAGGTLSMNSAGGIGTAIRTADGVTLTAGAINQGADSEIAAGSLATRTANGANLVGMNRVAAFNATNTSSGDVVLNNAAPLLTVTGVSAAPGDFTMHQDGDLAITGNVLSGAQSIHATGDMVVGSDSGSVALFAAGGCSNASNGSPNASPRAMGVGLLDRQAGQGPIDISARSLVLKGGSDADSFALITGGPVNIVTTGGLGAGDVSLIGGSGAGAYSWLLGSQGVNLDVGGTLRLDAGTDPLSFARIQTVRPTESISVHFQNLSSVGYFVNGEPVTRDGASGFFSGPAPAKPGNRLVTTYE